MPVKHTPLVAQYLSVKARVPDAILFFRLGDFYEMFFDDAELASRLLDIQLTSRSKDGVPLCGVPYHSADPYIARLLKAGHKVAICEQSTPDSGARRPLMDRRIVRVITPGTVAEETVLASGEKSFLAAVTQFADGFALAALDVSTGEFLLTRATGIASLRDELTRLAPREILIAKGNDQLAAALKEIAIPVTAVDSLLFDSQPLQERFGSQCSEIDSALASAAGAAIRYVESTFGHALAHLQPPRLYRTSEYMLLDETSRRHLELISSSDGAKQGSLLGVLDECLTAAGTRKLAEWIVRPLLDLDSIGSRHDAVEELFDSDLGGASAQALARIGDLERLAGRLGSLRASPRDCLRLADALAALDPLRASLAASKSALLRGLAGALEPQPGLNADLAAKISAALADEPPLNPRDGGLIRAGFDREVDELRTLATDSRSVLAQLEARERERAGIPSLKVRYNQVFGYYLEVTKTHLDRVPADYERKQTLVGAERFTTPELKELEGKILGAEAGLKELEQRLFANLLRDLHAHTASIQQAANAAAEIDALMALAKVARRRGYVRPTMAAGFRLMIRDCRHPVLEAAMRAGEFVPNDLDCDPDSRQLLLITGPNMAGKSTYLRQVALIVIMAQIGSFVPASEAALSPVDRVLTRIGARDELRRGESTFMVEMRETARLVENLTARSLLLLDEVGRGTSTFDGLAIAWALAEHLHDSTRAKILFATHFHELTDLARERPRVRNMCMTVREWGGEVLFLRRVIDGAASRSYGIDVARLAGLPDALIARAREILGNLERGELDSTGMPRIAQTANHPPAQSQMSLFSGPDARVLDELRALEVEHLTPVDALTTLARLTDRLRRGEG